MILDQKKSLDHLIGIICIINHARGKLGRKCFLSERTLNVNYLLLCLHKEFISHVAFRLRGCERISYAVLIVETRLQRMSVAQVSKNLENKKLL